jgi:hypothetical protein
MNTSLQWLSDFLPGAKLDAQRFGDALTHGGLPVEHFVERGDDTMLDVEVTSNRSDCLSHAGVARELAALLKLEFRDVKPVASGSADAGVGRHVGADRRADAVPALHRPRHPWRQSRPEPAVDG